MTATTLFGILCVCLASALALGGLIKFSLKRPATLFVFLGTFVMPLMALRALVQAMLPDKWFGNADLAIRLSTDGLQEAEDEVERMRHEMFGNRSPLWVTKRFEKRYNTYLDQSVKNVPAFRDAIKKPDHA